MKALERIRAERGLSIRIARELGIYPSTVSQWVKVPDHHVREVARISGMTLHELRPDLWPEPEGKP
jgi:DNA-binding transcriptional regulator YdaS (Cro superfamily)